MALTRRDTLMGLATAHIAISLPAPMMAQVRARGAGLLFDWDGRRFGLVITVLSRSRLLVTVRSLDGRFRHAALVPRRPSSGRVDLAGGAGALTISADHEEGLRIAGNGPRLVGISDHPSEGGGPQTQGWFGSLIRGIGAALEAVAVGIAAAGSWLFGWEYRGEIFGGRITISVRRDGGFGMTYDSGGIVPPPPEVEEDPTVWY